MSNLKVYSVENIKNYYKMIRINSLDTVEDYSVIQEKLDLERYRRFLNSFAYDDIKKLESEHKEKSLAKYIEKRSAYHDD